MPYALEAEGASVTGFSLDAFKLALANAINESELLGADEFGDERMIDGRGMLGSGPPYDRDDDLRYADFERLARRLCRFFADSLDDDELVMLKLKFGGA